MTDFTDIFMDPDSIIGIDSPDRIDTLEHDTAATHAAAAINRRLQADPSPLDAEARPALVRLLAEIAANSHNITPTDRHLIAAILQHRDAPGYYALLALEPKRPKTSIDNPDDHVL
jgi:hypothetical protein